MTGPSPKGRIPATNRSCSGRPGPGTGSSRRGTPARGQPAQRNETSTATMPMRSGALSLLSSHKKKLYLRYGRTSTLFLSVVLVLYSVAAMYDSNSNSFSGIERRGNRRRTPVHPMSALHEEWSKRTATTAKKKRRPCNYRSRTPLRSFHLRDYIFDLNYVLYCTSARATTLMLTVFGGGVGP